MKLLWYLWYYGLFLSLKSVQIRENMDQKNSEYRHFSHSVWDAFFQLL